MPRPRQPLYVPTYWNYRLVLPMVGKRKASEEIVELNTLKKIRTNQVLEYINSLENLIRNDKTQLNRILELFEYLQENSRKIKTLRAVMHALRNIFHEYELFRPKNRSDKTEASHEKTIVHEKVLDWLKLRYVEFLDQAFLLMDTESPKLQVMVFDVLMSCVRYETNSFSNLERQVRSYTFANDLFSRIVQRILSRGHMGSTLLWTRMLDAYLNVYDDVRFYFYKDVAKYLRELERFDSKSPPIMSSSKNRFVEGNMIRPQSFDDLTNCLWQLLPNIQMVTNSSELDSFLVSKIEKTSHLMKLKEHRRVFEDCWLAFLNLPLSSSLHKQILMFLDRGIIPHMLNPTMLMDFLTDSYDMGGSISLLALNSLFLLIMQHNL